MTAETAFVHIGVEKTGTTTIQQFLVENRQRLLERGVLYPLSAGEGNNRSIVRYSMTDERLTSPKTEVQMGGISSPESFRKSLLRKLDGEIGSNPHRHLAFSSEHCSSRLNGEEIVALKGLMERYAGTVKVICYLRRQDEIAISLYSTSMRVGSTEPFAFPKYRRKNRRFNFMKLLAPWVQTFGRENLILRRFGSPYFKNGRLLDDYLDCMGLERDGFVEPPPTNERLSIEVLERVRQFNLTAGQGPDAMRRRNRLLESLQGVGDVFLGASAAERQAFMEPYEETNQKVARKLLRLKEPLFTHPFADDAPPN